MLFFTSYYFIFRSYKGSLYIVFDEHEQFLLLSVSFCFLSEFALLPPIMGDFFQRRGKTGRSRLINEEENEDCETGPGQQSVSYGATIRGRSVLRYCG